MAWGEVASSRRGGWPGVGGMRWPGLGGVGGPLNCFKCC